MFIFYPHPTPITPQLCLACPCQFVEQPRQADSREDGGMTDQESKASYEFLMVQIYILESLGKIRDMVDTPTIGYTFE